MNLSPLKISFVVTAFLMLWAAVCDAAEKGTFRLGYVVNPGSALCLSAAAGDHFRQAGLDVALVRFSETSAVLEALESGTIAAGAVAEDEALKQIARGRELRIIAGGGRRETVSAGKSRAEPGIVVIIAGRESSPRDKTAAIQLVTALIRAHQTMRRPSVSTWSAGEDKLKRQTDGKAFIFDPNPDYWRLEKLWRRLGLSESTGKAILSDHVYEDIYCKALDRVLDEEGTSDPTLKELFDNAVCVPECSPNETGETVYKTTRR